MKFADISGHKKSIQHLVEMVDNNRLPHALLLSGPSGIGKMNIARALAQYVHCTNRSGGDSCGVCPACLQASSLSNPDIHFSYPIVKSSSLKVSSDRLEEWKQMLEESPYMSAEAWGRIIGAGNSQPIIHVDEAAEISRQAVLSPVVSDYKIFIIWQPEKLQPSAANKLLKLLEEPYPGTLFILVSNNPGLILPTIFSRTQRLNLHPLSDSETEDWLRKRSSLPAYDLAEIARLSEGNILRAGELLSQTGERGEFSILFVRLMRSAYARNITDLKDLSESLHAFGREKGIRFLNYCASMVRENFIYNMHNPALNLMMRNEEEFSRKFSPFINERNVEKITNAINEAATDIARNANGKIVWFDFMLLTSRYIRTS